MSSPQTCVSEVDLHAHKRITSNDRPVSCRWETRFARLVRSYGVAKLAKDLEVDPTAIYQWVRGSVSPRPDKAMLIVVLLKQVGRLRLDDIYQHRLTVQANARIC
jgi:DNA-binding XRE family transcriptional regulator